MAQTVFRRYEKKFLITDAQYAELTEMLDRNLKPDRFAKYTIANLYFDTPDYRLARISMEKPKYKEKLRVRCYGAMADEATNVFVEIKKKFDGIVYKRRVEMPLYEAADYLKCGRYPENDSQILREIDFMIRRYGNLRPAAYIAYDREAYSGKDDPDLRVTFDRRIRCRDKKLDFRFGDSGRMQLPPGTVLMEVKIPEAMPLWMSGTFSRLGIFMTSYSKYGTYYQNTLIHKMEQRLIVETHPAVSTGRGVRYA